MRAIDADDLLIQIQNLSGRNQKLFGDLINKSPTIHSGLNWEEPKDVSAVSAQNNIFLCYRSGFPLSIGYWRQGYGWRETEYDVRIQPECVAKINLPVGKAINGGK